MGNVHWNNFKTADNLLAGIEFSLTDKVSDNMPRIFNATVVGRTNNSEQLMFDVASVAVTRGIITPRTENFTVDSVKFYYFDWKGSAALGGCSHCYHPAATDSGARTVTFKNIYFDSTVVQKIKQQEPWRHIYYDLDGTLTGKGPNTYYTYGWNHNLQPECDFLPDIYDGVVCNSSVQVRRLVFWNWLPEGVFSSQVLNILQWDDSLLAKVNTSDYINSNNYSIVPFKDKKDPMFAWAVPFVTGHKYKINWGSTGLDFTQMQVDQSERWQQNDLNIILMHNFSMVRQAMNVTVNNIQVLNNTLPSLDIKSNLIQTGQNLVLNDSTLNQNLPLAVQTQFITAFNGKNMSGMERQIIWKGLQCVGACNAAVVVVPLGNITYWSDANSWINRNKTLPVDGDSVVIESGWNMILDINTPNLTKITINGRLSFLNTTNITLTSASVFIYAGELFIGSKEYPYKYNAKIQLEGGRFSTPIAFDGDVEGGNKILANVGTIKMYGIQRKYLFRLQQPAIRGSNQFFIDTGLDLIQGDQLGLLPTSYNHEASDQAFVQSYNSTTGLVILNSTLEHYHWGASMSTASKYNGVDIRGEVILLTRNIQIIGSALDGWGGQVVTSSTIDANMTSYNGMTIMDSVEIYGCSQSNTLRAALRFDGNIGSYSTISNSSIRNGLAWGLQIINSKNIYVTDMVLFGFTQIGANLQSVSNITVKYSVIGNIIERVQSAAQQSLQSTPLVDKRAGITVCGYKWPLDKCSDTFINNNIVGGAPYAGFVNPAQNCGETSVDRFYNNIAHSIKGAFGGHGLQTYADTSTNQVQTCYQVSTFIAYKCWFQGAFSYDLGTTVIFKNMTMIDNRLGLGISMGNAGNGNTQLIFNDNYIYGESEIPDCPNFNRADYCEVTDKAAIYPGQISKAGQTVMQSEIAHLPVFMNHFDTVNSNSRIIWNRNKFFYFKGKTLLKQQQSIIGSSDYSMDYTPMHEFYDTQFTDVEDSAMAKLMSPLPGWANIEDCGNFPCSGPNNLLYSFQNSVWNGYQIDYPLSDFQIIPNNPGVSSYVQNCQYKALWNGYYCNQNTLSILLFQSQDSDSLDRAYQPINITQYGTRVKNVLNALMDHGWDGFYTSHKRVSMFPALLDAPLGSVYNVTYTSTPPKAQQFQLISSVSNTGLTARIAYPDAVSYAIYQNGGIIEMNQWQTSINQYGPIKQRYCGENRYIGVQNILEFFITGNCTLQIKPRDAIQSMVRMEWTMSQFYSSGGTTKFANRLCAVLGIHASQMKVVSVYDGSLVINYNIVQDPTSSQSLQQISQLQTQVLATGGVDLGAPILDASSSISVGTSSGKSQSIIRNGVVTAGGYTPVSINSQSSSTTNLPKNVYIPDVPIIQQQQTIYRNVSVQVVTSQNQSQPDIIISNQSSDSSSKSWIAIPIVLGIFFIIVILVGVKWYVNTKKVKESDLLAIKAAKLRQQELAQFNSSQKLKGYDENIENSINVFQPEIHSKNGQKFQEVARSSAVEEYGQQYDPNNDFAIFGIGDKTKGGIQSLKEKMNLADVVENEEISSDEEKQIVPDEQTYNQSQSASNLNSKSTDGNSKSKPTSSQTVRNPNPQSEQNNMPENQEIYEL